MYFPHSEIIVEVCTMRHVAWRPRLGAKLSEIDKNPNTVELSAKHVLGKVPKVFLHPVWGILVAAFLTFSGRGEMQLRGIGLVLVAMWLSVDLWAWLILKRWKWRFVIGWVITSLMLIGAMGIMWWWPDGKLEDQRAEVFQKLSASHQAMPAAKEEFDPLFTLFTVTNDSSYTISGKHALICYVNLAVGANGYSRLDNIWESVDGKTMMFGAAVDQFRDFIPTLEPLQPGGDAQTDQCLKVIGFERGVACVDVTLIFWYSLETQPLYKQEKDFRFIAQREFRSSGHGKPDFVWYSEPIGSKRDFCRQFITN